MVELANAFLGEAAPLQSDGIQPIGMRATLGRGFGKRQHIARNGCAAADKSIFSDAHKVMHRAQRSHRRPVFYYHVPSERRRVGHDYVIADLAIVRNVRIGHDQVVAAHASHASALCRGAVNGDVLADHVVIANLQSSGFALVGNVLRGKADRTKRIELIIRTDFRRPFKRNVRAEVTTFAEFDIGANRAVRADIAGGREPGFGIEDSR